MDSGLDLNHWIQNDDGTTRCTKCGVQSFEPGVGSCECPPASGFGVDALELSRPAESRSLADSNLTGLPAGGLSYWENVLVEVVREIDIVRKRAYRDRKAAIALATTDAPNWQCERDSIRLRSEQNARDLKALEEKRKTAQQGYEWAKARDYQRMVELQERMVVADAHIRAGHPDKALAVLGSDAN